MALKIALVGTGRMGSAVRVLAEERGHIVVATFNSDEPLDTRGGTDGLCGADVVIDFSLPSVVRSHLHAYCAWGQPAVVGTTGWSDSVADVRKEALASGASLVCAPNFSLGIQLVLRAIAGLGPLLRECPEYDVAMSETHHTQKVDRPSGTALQLAEAMRPYLPQERAAGGAKEDLEIASLRLGAVFGDHSIILDSVFDQISLTHCAKGRKGFALGALKAAEWLPGRTGFFTLDDVLNDWIGTH